MPGSGQLWSQKGVTPLSVQFQIIFMRPNNVASLQYPVSTAFSLYTNSNLSVIAIVCVHRTERISVRSCSVCPRHLSLI